MKFCLMLRRDLFRPDSCTLGCPCGFEVKMPDHELQRPWFETSWTCVASLSPSFPVISLQSVVKAEKWSKITNNNNNNICIWCEINVYRFYICFLNYITTSTWTWLVLITHSAPAWNDDFIPKSWTFSIKLNIKQWNSSVQFKTLYLSLKGQFKARLLYM